MAEYKLCHVGRRSSDVHLCQRLHIQLYSWWWVQEAPETCRVVKKCNNEGHCPAVSCWFIKYCLVLLQISVLMNTRSLHVLNTGCYCSCGQQCNQNWWSHLTSILLGIRNPLMPVLVQRMDLYLSHAAHLSALYIRECISRYYTRWHKKNGNFCKTQQKLKKSKNKKHAE